MKCQLKIAILFIALTLFCVSTVHSKFYGCHKNYCWKYCKNVFRGQGQIDVNTDEHGHSGSPWCYTRTWKEPKGDTKKCQKDSDCGWIEYPCAGRCSDI